MKRQGITLFESLFVIVCLVILIGLLLPALEVTHSGGRRNGCQNNLRQIALAMANYHSAQQQFPPAIGLGRKSSTGSSGQLSAFVAILPFIDEGERYEQIRNGCEAGTKTFSPYPPLDASGFPPWELRMPLFECLSTPKTETEFAITHYGLCLGDRARNVSSPQTARGAFGGPKPIGFKDIEDGASNTFMAGEIGARTHDTRKNRYAINQPASILESPSQCYELIDGNGQDWQFIKSVSTSKIGRGGHWADGRSGVALFNTILPPMSPSVSTGENGSDGIYSASGPHKGGLNIARMDGSIVFIDSEIDAGDSSKPVPTEEEMSAGIESPYGVWGALGTINGAEIATEY